MSSRHRKPSAAIDSDPTVPQIVHGDCLEKLPELKPESVHLVITDPPYFLDGLDSSWRNGRPEARRRAGVIGGLPVGMKFDPKQGRALQRFIGEVSDKILPVLVPGAFAVVFSQPRLVHRMAVGMEDAGFEIRDLLAWHFTRRAQFKAFSMDHFIDRLDVSEQQRSQIKQTCQGRKTPQLRPQFEAMVLAMKPRQGTFVNNWRAYKTGLIDARVSLDGAAPNTLMSVEKPHRSQYNRHLTVKPLALLEHLIRLLSVTGQVVLDPFLGSGTTAIAAMKTGRSCIGIEINQAYITIANTRIKEKVNDRNSTETIYSYG